MNHTRKEVGFLFVYSQPLLSPQSARLPFPPPPPPVPDRQRGKAETSHRIAHLTAVLDGWPDPSSHQLSGDGSRVRWGVPLMCRILHVRAPTNQQ